jgi:hypothetical protein
VSHRILAFASVALASFLLVSAPPLRASSKAAAGQNSGSALRDLKSVADLRDRFNEDRSTTRLVLLLSPT